MKKIYICSPFRGDYGINLDRAKHFCRTVALNGDIPMAPHVYCSRFLDDVIPSERANGLAIGIELLKSCDELRVYGYVISEGMAAEIEEATKRGIPIVHAD